MITAVSLTTVKRLDETDENKFESFKIDFHRETEDPYFDKLQITPKTRSSGRADGPLPDAQALFRLNEAITRIIKIDAIPTPDQDNRTVSDIVGKQVQDLTNLNYRMHQDQRDSHRDWLEKNREYDRISSEREEASKKEFDAYKAMELEKIQAQMLDLEEKQKGFDISDHMRARRKQREEITQQIQTTLSDRNEPLTSINSFRWLICICLIGFASCAAFAYGSFSAFSLEASKTNSSASDYQYVLWFLMARGTASSLGAIGFLAYLVRCLRQAREDAITSHRDLQRYSMDINRSSWVIEIVMEMTSNNGAMVPEKWIEGATHDLFPSSRRKADGPVAALGALMGLSPEVTVGPEGTQFKMNGKALSQAAKNDTKEDSPKK